MALEIGQRQREGIHLLDLKGRITAGDEAAAFRSAIERVSRLGGTPLHLVLNMAEIDYVDSTGLGALVMSSTTARQAEGMVRLLSLNRRNLELLVMTKIDTIFEVFDDETEAVNSFFPDRKIKRFDILSFVQQFQDE
jgi:anti-sigma B factor antagonist